MKRWIGLFAHAVLGALFPYALGGAVVLLTGIDSPSGVMDKVKGIAIGSVYAALLVGVNVYTLRGLSRISSWRTAVMHAVVLAAAAAITIRI